jgi:hypothetical protein
MNARAASASAMQEMNARAASASPVSPKGENSRFLVQESRNAAKCSEMQHPQNEKQYLCTVITNKQY